MKRFMTITLVLVMVLAMSTSALAVEPAVPMVEPAMAPASDFDTEAELTAVTEKVVALLDVADDYTGFSGNYREEPRASWDLYWSKDDESLSVSGTAEGLITEVNYWRNSSSYDRFYGYDAAFPALDEENARAQAEGWLDKLMGKGESARIDETNVSLVSDGQYTFTGRVLKNGLESPVTFSIRIGADDLEQYYRSDSYRGFIREVPAAQPSAKEADAAKALSDAVAFELYYVSEKDGTARLRYVPVGPETVVDAQTGEAVDMDALYASVDAWYYEPEAPAAEASMNMKAMDAGGAFGRALTEVETTAISNYADVLPEEQLDTQVRAIAELGLGDFALDRCSYSMDMDGNITASLRYTCEMTENRLFGYTLENYRDSLSWGEKPRATKYISMDAKTGKLASVSTSYSLWDRRSAATADPGTAESFLRQAAPEEFARCGLCTLKGYGEGGGFTYARLHEGYFYPENTLTVTLNDATGTVDSYYRTWDDKIEFAASDGIVTEAQALAAYTDALTVTLGYVAWPEAIDYNDPILFAYADWGYSYVESLRLAYYYNGKNRVSGVDALTGKALTEPPVGEYAYDDLDGVPERDKIEALAHAGVGFAESSFRPTDALTVRDAARLLLSSAGYRVDDWDDDALKSEAVWQGFIAAGAWEPERAVTQAEYVQMILGASRYGDAAKLPGVGFETVARALGMISGAMPEGACTRADAAVLLYRFMTR